MSQCQSNKAKWRLAIWSGLFFIILPDVVLKHETGNSKFFVFTRTKAIFKYSPSELVRLLVFVLLHKWQNHSKTRYFFCLMLWPIFSLKTLYYNLPERQVAFRINWSYSEGWLYKYSRWVFFHPELHLWKQVALADHVRAYFKNFEFHTHDCLFNFCQFTSKYVFLMQPENLPDPHIHTQTYNNGRAPLGPASRCVTARL